MNLLDVKPEDDANAKPRSRGDEPRPFLIGASIVAKTPLTRG